MAIVVVERVGAIALITLNRPERRNAIDRDMSVAIEAALDSLESDPDLKVGILRATTTEPRPVFCAGADLTKLDGGDDDKAMTERGGFAGIVRYPRTKPLVAAVDGLATSGGLEIVLSCDLVVATERSAFALAEVRWGLVAAAGGLFRLPRAIGMAPALDVILTGTEISAERAYRLGLISTLTRKDATAAALERAERIAAHGSPGVIASLRVARRAFEDSEAQLWCATQNAFEEIAQSPEMMSGINAFETRARG